MFAIVYLETPETLTIKLIRIKNIFAAKTVFN
nr:MAG TPA: hypothetical protein [Caudoviricetes sp.]